MRGTVAPQVGSLWNPEFTLKSNLNLFFYGNRTICLVGQNGGEGVLFDILEGSGESAAAYPSNDGKSECAGQHGSATEEEGGCVTSCNIN